MLASVSQAIRFPQPSIACPSIRFKDRPDVTEIEAQGNLRPIGNTCTRDKVTFPWGHTFEIDEVAVSDAALVGTMLAGSVSNCLRGEPCRCGYMCDTDFGCDECIPKGLSAVPAECRQDVKGAIDLNLDWIADTGSAQDLVNDSELPDNYGYYSSVPIRMITANGESSSSKQGKVFVPKLGRTIDPYLVQSSPPVISVGMRCIDDKFDFIWRGSKGENPYMVKPNGERIELIVKDYVPYLANNSNTISTASVRCRPTVATPASEEAQQSPEPDGEIEIVGDEPVDMPQPPPETEMPEDDEASRKVGPPTEAKSKGSSSSVHDEGSDFQRSLGEKALRDEATSIQHMLTHIPKNPYCDICQRAKMFKPPSYAVGGSTKVEAEKFGDHITADFIITRDEEEVGIDDERNALVVKDVATGFMYVYPNARRTTNAAVLALKHFVGHNEEVGVFYSDNAPELISAMKVLQWRHVLSRDYISKSNAQAERAVRSVLEGTRVNLLQSGLNHWHWPHAARHWCLMQNIIATGGKASPWELRFGEKFDGPMIPFGCLVDYWNGPRKKNKDNLRFDPTSSPGIFLGYAIHPEFSWRNEFMIVPSKNLVENEANGTSSVLRVMKIIKPDDTHFPLQGRSEFGKDAPGLDQALGNQWPTLEDQDAPMPEDVGPGESYQLSTAHAVHDEAWLPFMRHIKDREGWYEYADCHVNVKRDSESYVSPNDNFRVEDYPYRTTCHRKDDAWFILDQNFIMWPKYEEWNQAVATCEVMFTIFSKNILDLRERVPDSPKSSDDEDDDSDGDDDDDDTSSGKKIEVINPTTGLKEMIRADDPSFYSADGFKTRRYKGSSKPLDIPSFVWQSMSTKARREAIREEQKKLARKGAERTEKKRATKNLEKLEQSKKGVASIVNQLHSAYQQGEDPIPTMPTCKYSQERHRVKCARVSIMSGEKIINTLVARPVNKKEIRANPKAQESLDIEWNKLVKKTAWLYDTVQEWSKVSDGAKKKGKKVHVGKVFEICVEKGSELPEGHKLRKFKGRTVFQGNNVRDENADVALFSELGSSPATMEAGKAVDAYGAQPGFVNQQNDGVQAYTQALMKGVETWVELPVDRWPKEWIGKYRRPVVLLRIALYGHPDSGGLWEIHCEKMLVTVGFIMPDPEGWPSVFFHPELKLLLVVYVDDFKMSGPKESIAKGWELIASKIDMDVATDIGRYLGCDHMQETQVRLKPSDHPFAYLFDKSLPDPAAKEAAAASRTQDFWEIDSANGVYIRHHCQPRKGYYVPEDEVIKQCDLTNVRFTDVVQCSSEDAAVSEWDLFRDDTGGIVQGKRRPSLWVGTTYLFTKSCQDPKNALASIKRDKNSAKKKARAQGFRYMDQIFENQPCMSKPVNVMTYDMKPFLQSCIDRYQSLAGKDAKPLKHAATPFHEERIARPLEGESEQKGALAPIAARVLMKILFAARMARYDLLRAVQGLAARVTKWSTDCDRALHRLMCYIHSTLDYKLKAFVGDQIQQCRLWCFADADHAGEYDNKSTTGCFLVLIGPNTYFPLTAFSKKQTSVSISSTEAEVVAANISLRAVGLPSSGLWAYLQNAGGESSTPEGLPLTNVTTQLEKDGEYWEFIRDRRILVRVHPKKRSHLFLPEGSKTIPIPIRRIGLARTTILAVNGTLDFVQDNWKKKRERPMDFEWTGKTYFRVYGPYETDYEVEASEVREALTDFEFVGQEKMGDYMISLFPPPSIRGVFVEDNQATIRILENGKSPTFRHTDKTQRINLSWLSEQYRRGWYTLTYGPSKMQVADILTKPFTNAEKWKFAISLMSHVLSPDRVKSAKPQLASPSEPQSKAMTTRRSCGEPTAGLTPQRLLVEICCNPDSKLSDTTRESAVGCRIVQFTEKHNLLEENYRRYVADIVNSFPSSKPVLLWLSLPCTGGTSWSYVNLTIPSAAKKVMRHVKALKKLWKAVRSFMELLCHDFYVAIEWPQNCRYWKFPMVVKFIDEFSLIKYDFHGCMLGTTDQEGNPIKKPWTVATSMSEVGESLSQFQCDGNHTHVQGRGKPLKNTESYTFQFTDVVHQAFNRAATSARKLVSALPAVRLCSVMSSSIAADVGVSSHSEERAVVAGMEHWKQDAEFQVENIPAGERLSVYARVQEWERRLAKVRASCAACVFPDGYEGANRVGSGQTPIGFVVDGLLGSDEHKSYQSYQDFVHTVNDVPAALFGMCDCPPEGEADLIIIGDSSFALVANHDEPARCSRLSFGELLQSKEFAIDQIRSVYPGLKWGKGLSAINHEIWELIAKIERENRLQGRPTLPILVVVGWAGNDVHGDYGYQGCTWIHQKHMNKSQADRKVAADYVEKQYERVQRSLKGLVEIENDPRILSVQVIGNAAHEYFSLPPSYNREMGKHVTWLGERCIQTVNASLLCTGSKYDNFHLVDHSYNRKLVYRFLRGAITLHLKYKEIMACRDVLRGNVVRFIKDDQDRRAAVQLFPSIIQFRLALARTQEVMMALTPQEKTSTPAEEFDKADEEVLMWVHAGICEADEEATREGRPEPVIFTNDEIASIVPVDPKNEDSETEEQRARLYLQEDLNQAVEDGFSIATVESIEVIDDNLFPPDEMGEVEVVPGIDEWDVIEPSAIIINPHDEKVKVDEIAEERKKEVEDLNRIIELTSEKPPGTAADDDAKDMEKSQISSYDMSGSFEVIPMDADKEPEVTTKDLSQAPWKGEPTAAAKAKAAAETASSSTPTQDDAVIDVDKDDSKPAGKPAVKKMPKQKVPEPKTMPRAKAPRLNVETDRALKKLEEATEAKEQAVWLDPEDMGSRIPKEYCGQGRLRFISTKLSYLVRGHAIENGARSPEFDPLELSMDFDETMRVLSHLVWYPTIKEVLSIVRNSETRRFQVKVTKPDLPDATWKGLPWKVIAIRAVQGHNKSVMETAKLSGIVKQVFTLDPTFTIKDLDSYRLPKANVRPDLVPELMSELPRIIYHSCDLFVLEKILEHGLIPGGWPNKTGRAHNHFIAGHPWTVGNKKLAGTRAGKQYYVAFDTELVVQSGNRLFRTDEAILSPDWVSNETIICVYDAYNREFFWVSRAYEATRNGYNKMVKDNLEKDTPKSGALMNGSYARARLRLKSFLDAGNTIREGEMKMISDPERLSTLERKREGADGLIIDSIDFQNAFFGALTNAQIIRKGPFMRKGRGKGRRPEGSAEGSTNSEDYLYNVKIQSRWPPCHFCQKTNIEGMHKCQHCFKWLIGWTDGRIATEVIRLENTAKKTNGVFSLDRIDFDKQPRAQRINDRARADQRRAGRSNFATVRSAALTHAGRYAKLGYKSILDRMERDPYYLFNTARGQITPDCCEFLDQIAKCLSPDFGRSREERDKQLGTGVVTRLVFMPDHARDIRKPLDVTKEAFVAHYARFFSLPQFAVLAMENLKAKGEPSPLLQGWLGAVLPIDQSTTQDCFFDMVDFARNQWEDMYHDKDFDGKRYSFEEKATASDVPEFPRARGQQTTEGRQGLRRDFDPVARPEKGKGRGKGYGKQRPIFQSAVECWHCGQYGHRSFECPNRRQRQGWNWQSWQGYSRRSEGQAGWSNRDWNQQSYGWNDPWPTTGSSSSSSRAPPTPPEPRREQASGSAAPRTSRVVKEEYAEVNGVPHTKRTYADGTVEFESW